MLRIAQKNIQRFGERCRKYSVIGANQVSVPKQADVVIIGGGSAGCYTLYHLAKRGVSAVLLERAKLTSGTTWHTNGLMWRIRPNDTDIQLLNSTRDTVREIQEQTEFDPGWIENGGLFIARNQIRLDEYKRLSTIAKVFGIEHSMLTSDETLKLFPILNRDAFVGSLYSPGDGIIDPTMLCNALTRLAVRTSNAQVIENCPVKEILVEQNSRGVPRITGLRTDHGEIKTSCVVNATGAWGRDLIEPHGISLPLIPMKHSYVVSEPITGIKGLPNLRDHDASIAFRVQGSSIYLGGYEKNPIILDRVGEDFSFSLYDLDWSTFDDHIEGAVELCPAFGEVGIKCTVCGPETFTPDHKAILGPDPRMIGLFHNCGFNSAGMMFGGGCGEQIAEWIIHGRPELYMFNFDVRRFTPKQMADKDYNIRRCHEAYAENYSAVFAHTQPLAGRNFQTDALHEELIARGAVMEEKFGWERPAFFHREELPVRIPDYDWYGAYGNTLSVDETYKNILKGDQSYDFSAHHDRIGAEAMSCRSNAAVFNLSSSCKILISGPDAEEALEWICTNKISKKPNTTVYTCALNSRGGVEAHFTVTSLDPGEDPVNSRTKNRSYYIVADGAYANHTISHINEGIDERKFNATVEDVTNPMGILSIQGPKSRQIVELLTEISLKDEILPLNFSIGASTKIESKALPIRIQRTSFLGELGYELHIDSRNCVPIYRKIMAIGCHHGLINAGFRAYNSLNCEAGHLMWGSDLRSDDSPVEANLGVLCRADGNYRGSKAIRQQLEQGANKRLISLTLDDGIPLWGLEGVYLNGKAVGYLRRADFGYYINKSIGKTFINTRGEKLADWKNGKYEIDVLGKFYPAKLNLGSPLGRNL